MATRRTTVPPRNIPTLSPAETPEQKPAPRKRAARAAAPKAETESVRAEISAEARRGMIAEAAYLRAERRGFVPGYELEDWIAAESEVDALLEADHGRRPQ